MRTSIQISEFIEQYRDRFLTPSAPGWLEEMVGLFGDRTVVTVDSDVVDVSKEEGRRIAAYHEAAHAVIAWRNGYENQILFLALLSDGGSGLQGLERNFFPSQEERKKPVSSYHDSTKKGWMRVIKTKLIRAALRVPYWVGESDAILEASVHLAGPIAEQLYVGGEKRLVLSGDRWEIPHQCFEDMSAAAWTLWLYQPDEKIVPSLRKCSRREERELRWPKIADAVTVLADQLLEKGALDQAEIGSLLNKHLPSRQYKGSPWENGVELR